MRERLQRARVGLVQQDDGPGTHAFQDVVPDVRRRELRHGVESGDVPVDVRLVQALEGEHAGVVDHAALRPDVGRMHGGRLEHDVVGLEDLLLVALLGGLGQTDVVHRVVPQFRALRDDGARQVRPRQDTPPDHEERRVAVVLRQDVEDSRGVDRRPIVQRERDAFPGVLHARDALREQVVRRGGIEVPVVLGQAPARAGRTLETVVDAPRRGDAGLERARLRIRVRERGGQAALLGADRHRDRAPATHDGADGGRTEREHRTCRGEKRGEGEHAYGRDESLHADSGLSAGVTSRAVKGAMRGVSRSVYSRAGRRARRWPSGGAAHVRSRRGYARRRRSP